MQISEEMVDRAMDAFTEATNSVGPCAKCEGQGYHHGFGEGGHDPDWCTVCGGAGFVPGLSDRDAMMMAIMAALSKTKEA